jgi:hypothetical protein
VGSADEVLAELWTQNEDAVGDYRPGACRWLGKPDQSRRKAALRIKLSTAEEANDLIVNGVFLNYAHLKVSKYWNDGPSKGRTRSLYYTIPERATSPEDQMEEDENPFQGSSSPSPPLDPLSQGGSLTTPETQEALETQETSRDTSISSDSRG